jgi:hypothetical protein
LAAPKLKRPTPTTSMAERVAALLAGEKPQREQA